MFMLLNLCSSLCLNLILAMKILFFMLRFADLRPAVSLRLTLKAVCFAFRQFFISEVIQGFELGYFFYCFHWYGGVYAEADVIGYGSDFGIQISVKDSPVGACQGTLELCSGVLRPLWGAVGLWVEAF